MGEIPQRGDRQLKSIIIDNKRFRYNKDKPISNTLKKKLYTYKKTNEFQSYARKLFKDLYFDTKLKLALKRTAVRNKFRIEDVRSAFKGYANSVKLVNTFFKGEEGLQML